MKSFFIYIPVFFFATCFSFGQSFEMYKGDTINVKDANNRKQGHWIIFDASKTAVQEEGGFVNSRRDGIWKKYFSSGKIKHEITYIKGKPDGYAKFYYENGNVSEEGIWKMNKWVGEYKYYFENGNMSYLWNYNESGKRTGEQKYYYENGNVMIEGEWNDGKESGIIKEYYESGSLKSEKNFAEGVLEPATVKTYEPKMVVVKQQPEKQTSTQTQNKNVGVFDGNGYHKTYNMQGLPDREGVFKGGKFMDGKRFYYDGKGKLTKTEYFRNGKIVNVRTE
jgi:antitoxin component YwqK of YwqJK toxin-antitoxin module